MGMRGSCEAETSDVPSRECEEAVWWLGEGGLRRLSELVVEDWSASGFSFSFCFDLVLRAEAEATPLTVAFRFWCLRSRSLRRAWTAEGARRAVGEEL